MTMLAVMLAAHAIAVAIAFCVLTIYAALFGCGCLLVAVLERTSPHVDRVRRGRKTGPVAPAVLPD